MPLPPGNVGGLVLQFRKTTTNHWSSWRALGGRKLCTLAILLRGIPMYSFADGAEVDEDAILVGAMEPR